jgi:hypothetical protein
MKVYTSGWPLQDPSLNFFKAFLRLNAQVRVDGIIYPKRLVQDIDGIPVLDLDMASGVISPDDIVLDGYRPRVENASIRAALTSFFASKSLKLTAPSDFIRGLIEADAEDALVFPLPGIKSRDLRAIRRCSTISLIDDAFADVASFRVAHKLDAILRAVDFDQMLDFDSEDTPDGALLQVFSDLYLSDIPAHFRILGDAREFLNALVQLKVAQPTAEFQVELPQGLAASLGPQRDFYHRHLDIAHTTEAGNSSDTVTLGGDMQTLMDIWDREGRVTRAVFFMRRSVIDFHAIRHLATPATCKILLRQPDTSPANLIAATIVD